MNTENSGIKNKNIYKWKNYLKLPYIGVLLIATGTFLPFLTVSSQQGLIAKTAIGNGYGILLLILCVLIVKFLKSKNYIGYIGVIVCGVIDVKMVSIIGKAIYRNRNVFGKLEDVLYGIADIFNARNLLKTLDDGTYQGKAGIGFWFIFFGGLIVIIAGAIELIKNRKKIQI